MTWIGLSMMHEQKSKLQWRSAQKLVDLYADNGITTVGLKGITVAQWYPNPMQRDSCDFDCFLLKEGPDGRRVPAYEDGNRVEYAHQTPVRLGFVYRQESFAGLGALLALYRRIRHAALCPIDDKDIRGICLAGSEGVVDENCVFWLLIK